ncbi:MAG: DNA repair protein RecN [Propionibacteriaceae bacterium]
MLTELSLVNVGVIEQATLTLPAGFVAITGETGAGKTMVVGSLTTICSAKSDQGLVRHGTDRAIIEARFSQIPEELLSATEESGGVLDDGELIIARHLTKTRSRAFVGGAQTPAAKAADIAAELVTIYGQSEQIRLAAPERQREILDRACGEKLAIEYDRYRELWGQRRRISTELADLTAKAQQRLREIDVLSFGIAEINKIAPISGEDEALAEEARRLHDADDLRAAAQKSLAAIAGNESDDISAVGLLVTAKKVLERQVSDPELARIATAIADTTYALTDIATELSQYLAAIDVQPDRLEVVASRRAELQYLRRKYGDTLDQVLAWEKESSAQLLLLQDSDQRIDKLQEELSVVEKELQHSAATLSQLRHDGAQRLENIVLREMRALALPHARLTFQLTQLAELGPYGNETAEILFSANPGSELAPLGKVASGGELSRVRLALEVALADSSTPQTFIFDEVDAGVGGATALEIGRRLAELANYHQVIVVTHLAQVAAFADAHFVVTKHADGNVTTSGIRRLDSQQQEAELARMMGGLEADSARVHARDLLAEAHRRSDDS